MDYTLLDTHFRFFTLPSSHAHLPVSVPSIRGEADLVREILARCSKPQHLGIQGEVILETITNFHQH